MLAPNEGQPARRVRALPGWRGPLEALTAVVLLGVMAAIFHPVAPRPPSAAERWLERNSQPIVALARDITSLQGSLVRGSPATAPRAARRLVLQLRQDLGRAEHLGAPPGGSMRRIWASALEETGAALRTLSASGSTPAATMVASARADLDAAGQAVVAVSAAAHSATPLRPHWTTPTGQAPELSGGGP